MCILLYIVTQYDQMGWTEFSVLFFFIVIFFIINISHESIGVEIGLREATHHSATLYYSVDELY